MDRDELKAVLEEVLHQKLSIDEETHRDDHEFIAMLKRREKRRIELRQQFQKSFIGVAVLAVFAFLGWVGTLILGWFKSTGGQH